MFAQGEHTRVTLQALWKSESLEYVNISNPTPAPKYIMSILLAICVQRGIACSTERDWIPEIVALFLSISYLMNGVLKFDWQLLFQS